MPRRVAYASALIALLLGACSTGAPPATIAAAVPAPPPPAPSLPADEAQVAADNHVDILFPDGSDVLSDQANQQLDVAARLYRDVHPVKMFAAGHSDPSGAEFSNLLLSARRARAVKDAMVARGIPGDRVFLQALGTSDLAEPGQPAAPGNRRVVVSWQKS